jgi:hypothetical protein
MSDVPLAVFLGLLFLGTATSACTLQHITSITIDGERIDRTHTAAVGAWTIGFGAARPWATYPKAGTVLNGLRCGHPSGPPAACSLFMVIGRFESRASSCRIRQAGHEEKIACPQEIRFAS